MQVVQAPVGGVVEEILVDEGELVEKGQVVATLDETSTEAQIESNKEISARLNAETNFYRAQLSGATDAPAPEGVSADLVQRGTRSRRTFGQQCPLPSADQRRYLWVIGRSAQPIRDLAVAPELSAKHQSPAGRPAARAAKPNPYPSCPMPRAIWQRTRTFLRRLSHFERTRRGCRTLLPAARARSEQQAGRSKHTSARN